MTDLQDQLAQIRERMEAAEPYAEQMDAGYPPHSEAVVLRSQADVPRLLESVEAVLVKCEELEVAANMKPPENEYADGISGAATIIRRILTEELGADDERL